MLGSTTGTLRVITAGGVSVWQATGVQGIGWELGQAIVGAPQFFFEYTSAGRLYGDIGIAAVSIECTTPFPPLAVHLPSPALPELVTGGGVREGETHFAFRLERGTTPSSDTGPLGDQTIGNRQGTYIFMETSAPRQIGDVFLWGHRGDLCDYGEARVSELTFW